VSATGARTTFAYDAHANLERTFSGAISVIHFRAIP
jgi:hypothetical protein